MLGSSETFYCQAMHLHIDNARNRAPHLAYSDRGAWLGSQRGLMSNNPVFINPETHLLPQVQIVAFSWDGDICGTTGAPRMCALEPAALNLTLGSRGMPSTNGHGGRALGESPLCDSRVMLDGLALLLKAG